MSPDSTSRIQRENDLQDDLLTPSSPRQLKELDLAPRKAICDALRTAQSFLIVGHRRPDGDCLGSQMALGLGLVSFGKKVTLYTPGPVMNHLKFVPQFERFVTELPADFKADVTVFCDCGGIDRAGDEFKPVGTILNIDHHLSNSDFGDVNWVDIEASSTGEMICHVLRGLDAPITPDMANCLYLALMADTGSFKFANTNHRVFEMATDLVRLGADPSWIASEFYDSLTPGTLQLRGAVLSNLRFECDGRLCWSEVDQKMYRACGGEASEPEGLVSDLRSIVGVEVSILIHEVAEGGARAGLRSRGTWDVQAIAAELGGGGHRNAAGCYIRGDYAEVRDRIIRVAAEHLSRPPEAQARAAAGA
jgi:phosphoesterase RecJ-like protein